MHLKKNQKKLPSAKQATAEQPKSVVLGSQKSNKLQKVRYQLQKNKHNLQNILHKINTQITVSQKAQEITQKNQKLIKTIYKQKVVNQSSKHLYITQSCSNNNSQNCCQKEQSGYYKSKENQGTKQFKVNIQSTAIFYPPSCSAYDLAYCKNYNSIYAYGGISCTAQLQEGLKQYFYQYQSGIWKQIKPVSLYTPMPRYGHTLTAANESLLLFGGVSEYKQKLKDRCFYPDVWSFNVQKSSWKLLQLSGPAIRPRKSHSACIYNNFYIIHGGIDDCEEVISQICWINLQERKSKWRYKKIQPRFNHQMAVYYAPYSGRDYLFLFGGRNKQSEIIGELVAYNLHIMDGQLQFREGFRIEKHLIPCQFPIMTAISDGIIIMGGIDENNEPTQQCWYFSAEKQSLQSIKTDIDWKQLRGAKSVSVDINIQSNNLNGKSVYILSGSNSKKYKAIKITYQDEQFK